MTSLRTSLAALLFGVVTLGVATAQATGAITGPAARDVRATSAPVDVRTLALPKSVEASWLQKDVDMIWQVRSALPPAHSATTFFRALHAPDTQAIDLGYGYTRHTAAFGAGYSSCFFTAASHDDALLALRVICQSGGDKEALAAILPTIEQALGPAFTPDDDAMAPHAVKVAYDFPAATIAARDSLAKAVGRPEPIDAAALSPEVRAAYDLLASPVEGLVVGTSCGFGGQTSPGRHAAMVLQSARRLDLLRNVLRGPNPEGRVFAADALRASNALRAEDEAIVKKLAALPIAIETCHGCIHDHVTSADALQPNTR